MLLFFNFMKVFIMNNNLTNEQTPPQENDSLKDKFLISFGIICTLCFVGFIIFNFCQDMYNNYRLSKVQKEFTSFINKKETKALEEKVFRHRSFKKNTMKKNSIALKIRAL